MRTRLSTMTMIAGFLALVMVMSISMQVPAAAQPEPQEPAGTPVVNATQGLPPEAQAALEAFQADPEAEVQQRLPFPIAYVFLPSLFKQVAVAPAPDPTITPTPAPAADLILVVRPDPSIRVARDTQLAYNLRIRNAGPGVAAQAELQLPYNPDQLRLVNFASEQEGDFVSEREPGDVTVTFAALEPEEARSATLLFDVAETLPDDTVIDVRGNYTWQDARNGGGGRTNWAPVLVGSFNNDSRYVFLEIMPNSGPAGTFFDVYTDRFLPYEPVAAWFNTPAGIEGLERDLSADAFGRVAFSFASTGFAPGTYELILYGQRSKLTAVQEFTVQ